jgi:hypothetical protein
MNARIFKRTAFGLLLAVTLFARADPGNHWIRDDVHRDAATNGDRDTGYDTH